MQDSLLIRRLSGIWDERSIIDCVHITQNTVERRGGNVKTEKINYKKFCEEKIIFTEHK